VSLPEFSLYHSPPSDCMVVFVVASIRLNNSSSEKNKEKKAKERKQKELEELAAERLHEDHRHGVGEATGAGLVTLG